MKLEKSNALHGWRTVKLGELCERIDYGFTASADFSTQEPRFLRITDIQNGRVDWDSVPGCKISVAETEQNRLCDGDIVFARTGATTGKSFLIKSPPEAVFASYLIRMRLKKECDPEFFSLFLQGEDYWRQIRSQARGGAQPNFNASMLSALQVKLPDLPEQRRLATRLRAQMAEVENASAAVQAQLEAAQTLPAALLRAIFSSPAAHRWPKHNLGDLLEDACNGLYKPDQFCGRGTPILKMFNIGRLNGQWDLTRVDKIEVTAAEQEQFGLLVGDIMFNRVNSRELVGKCAVVDESTAGAVFESKNMRLRLKTNVADPIFVATFLNSQPGRLQVEKRTRQIIGMATVNRSDLNSFEIGLPSIQEQKKFVARLDAELTAARSLVQTLETRLAEIELLPAALLRTAFNPKN